MFEISFLDVALLTRVDLETILVRSLVELGLSIRCGKRLQELLVWGRESIIDFIARRPKCVYQELELDHKMKEDLNLPPPVFGSCVNRKSA